MKVVFFSYRCIKEDIESGFNRSIRFFKCGLIEINIVTVTPDKNLFRGPTAPYYGESIRQI